MDGKLRNMSSVYLLHESKMLFLYRIGSRVVSNSYVGSAGGHFEKEELNDARACVLRELNEETGLNEEDLTDLTLRYITLRLKNGEIRQNYYFFANLINADRNIISNEGRLKWADINDIASLDMPFTAKQVIDHYISIGKNTTFLYGGIAAAEGVIFVKMQDF